MLIKVSEATNLQINWLVAKCEDALHPLGNVVIEGKSLWLSIDGEAHTYMQEDVEYTPSTDWAQGGPIIEREKISVIHMEGTQHWVARKFQPACDTTPKSEGPTSLIAAMRCLVASKLGDEVDVPDELINN